MNRNEMARVVERVQKHRDKLRKSGMCPIRILGSGYAPPRICRRVQATIYAAEK